MIGVCSLVFTSCLTAASPADPFLNKAFSGFSAALPPMRPGAEDAQQGALLVNKTNHTVVLRSVSVIRHGLGSVVDLVRTWVAPVYGNRHATPGGDFVTIPPTLGDSQRCEVQRLFPVRGYRMVPGQDVRILELFRASEPGHMATTQMTVNFEEGGVEGSAVVTWGTTASVSRGAPPIPVPSTQRSCLRGTRLLPRG